MHREIGSFAIASCFMPLFLERKREKSRKGDYSFHGALHETLAIPGLQGLERSQIVRYCIFSR